MGFAIIGVGLVLYSRRQKGGVLQKIVSSAGLGLLARSFGATSLGEAPALLLGLLNRAGYQPQLGK